MFSLVGGDKNGSVRHSAGLIHIPHGAILAVSITSRAGNAGHKVGSGPHPPLRMDEHGAPTPGWLVHFNLAESSAIGNKYSPCFECGQHLGSRTRQPIMTNQGTDWSRPSKSVCLPHSLKSTSVRCEPIGWPVLTIRYPFSLSSSALVSLTIVASSAFRRHFYRSLHDHVITSPDWPTGWSVPTPNAAHICDENQNTKNKRTTKKKFLRRDRRSCFSQDGWR